MTATEKAVEMVGKLDEARARQLIEWLQTPVPAAQLSKRALGAEAMLGFARRFNATPRRTSDWLAELREGERD
jgi:hypothetical protein